jgi:MarR family transcriptional regulator, temperature-dependent positive regulator of motility
VTTTPDAVAAVRAWTHLDQAMAAFDRALRADHGITGRQLAVLRLVDEWGPAPTLAELRRRLVLHPATLGQLVDRLAGAGLVELAADAGDRRRRTVGLTAAGRRLLAAAPLAGPVRLRHTDADPARLRRLAAALTDAIELFGLEGYPT